MYKNFICPVKNARITSNFGYRTIFGKKEWHQGVDFASIGKVPIYASADGEVYRTGVLSTYGNVVMIKHSINGKRMDTNYAHLDSYCVKVGQKVKQGQQIGVMGTTGRSTGIHLHFEIHKGAWKAGQPNAVDPMKYINLSDWNKNVNTEEITMSQYNELKKQIEQLQKQLEGKVDIPRKRNAGESHKEAWQWLTQQAITNGDNPQAYVTREQFASLLKRYHDKFVK